MPPGIHVSLGASHSSDQACGGDTGSCTPRAWFPGLWNRLLDGEGICREKCSAEGPALLVLPSGSPPPLPLAKPHHVLPHMSSLTPLPNTPWPLGQAAVSQPQPHCSHHDWRVPLTSLPSPLATAQLPTPSTSCSIEKEEETEPQ